MRAFTAKNRDEWHKLLKFAMFAYNNSVHTTTGYTPHELAHGFSIQIPTHLHKNKPIYNYDSLADRVRNQIADTLEIAREHLHNRKLINKKNYDKNSRALDIEIGDLILLKTQTKNEKFQFIYEGPYKVTQTHSEYIEIVKNNRPTKVHKNLVKKLDQTTGQNIHFLEQLQEPNTFLFSDENLDNRNDGSDNSGNNVRDAICRVRRTIGAIFQRNI